MAGPGEARTNLVGIEYDSNGSSDSMVVAAACWRAGYYHYYHYSVIPHVETSGRPQGIARTGNTVYFRRGFASTASKW